MVFYQIENANNNSHVDSRLYTDIENTPHIHSNFEVLYVIDGKCRINVNTESEMLSAGSAALFLSNQVHSFHVYKDSHIWVCVFSDDFIPDFAKQFEDKEGERTSFSCSSALIDMIDFYVSSRRINIYFAKALFYEICAEYLRDNTLIPRKPCPNILLYKIIQYISDNYKDSISLKSCASALGYEPHYLSRYFNSEARSGFSEFVNTYRINYAYFLLLTTKLSITAISEQCGFSTIRNFNNVFKRFSGVSPSEYRKQKGNPAS